MSKLHLLHHHSLLLPKVTLTLTLALTLTLTLVFDLSSHCNGLNPKQKCGNLDINYPFCVKNSSCEDRKPFHGMEYYELECDSETAWLSLNTQGQQQPQRYEVLGLGPKMIRINPLHENDDECGSNNLHSFNLIGSPFRLSTQNILQLYNCSQECYNCTIPLSLNTSTNPNCSRLPHQKMCCEVLDNSPYWGTFFNRFPSSQSSDFNSLNSSGSDFTSGFTSLENYTLLFGCSAFTAWAYSTYAQDSSFHAEFGLNLDWYLEGPCLCSSNSKCIQRPGMKGFNCQCNPPYSGDGYVQCLLVEGSTDRHQGKKAHVFGVFDSTVFLAGVITAAFIIGAAVIIGAMLLRRRKEERCDEMKRRMAERKGDLNMFRGLLSGLELFSYKQLHKATKGFSPNEKLGNGATGAVYSANLEDGRRVAVKRLHHFHTQIGYRQMVNELSVLCTVKHRNLVRLFGYCIESSEPLLVFEFVSNGTLAEHLQRERGEGLSWFTRLAIAAETADALAYLHSMTPPVLHRDVKSRNILLDHEFNTKVADFGLSRMGTIPSLECSHISTVPQGTPGYLDPDYHQNFHLSDKSDVYSFGVVLIEIITSLKPVDFSREKKEVNLAALAVAKIGSGRLDDIIDKSLQAHRRLSVKAMVQRVAELAFRCLAYDKDARPCMREVLEELLLIRGSVPFSMVDLDEGESGCSLSSLEEDHFLLAKKTISSSSDATPRTDSKNSSSLDD